MGAVVPRWLSLPSQAARPPADLPEGVGAAELAEEHGHTLAPAGEAAGVALRVGVLHRPLKVHPGEELEELAEHTGEATHCWASFPVTVLVSHATTR